MASRRDQLQSYQFMVQRVISAFVMRETDPAQSPLRRGVGAVFAGVMIAVVVAAGFGVYGILNSVGGDSWKADGSVVIEKETGASFIYLGGQLHPTLNYTSALLAAGKPSPTVARVSAKSLSGVPRGLTVGIPGAPDSLPNRTHRVGLPWTVCTTRGTDSSGKTVSTVTLLVPGAPAGATALDDRGLLAKDTNTGATYLIWHGHRYLVQKSATVVPALFGALVTAAPAGTAWLNSLPGGLDVGPISFTARGTPSPAVPGHFIGQVLVAGPGRYLVFDDGLAPVTPLQEAILGSQYTVRPVPATVTEVTAAPRSNRLNTTTGEFRAPETAPPLATPAADDPLCAVTTDARAAPEVRFGGAVSGLDAAVPTGSVSPDGVRLADRVLVPPGQIAVIRVLASPTADAGAYYLVTDLGVRYAVAAPTVLPILGYLPTDAVDVPASLVTRIPAGPALDPDAATRVAPPP